MVICMNEEEELLLQAIATWLQSKKEQQKSNLEKGG